MIHSDLTGGSVGTGAALDLTKARRLKENLGIAFQGPVKVGVFDIPGALAKEWLALPPNPNGRPNSDVVRPWANGMDITRRPRDMYIIDFGVDMPENEAALYEAPFAYVRFHVKPERDKNRDAWRRTHWWLHGRSGEDLRRALASMRRYVATPRVAKHRLFVWLDVAVLPDSAVVAIARDDDCTFGIVHSRFHGVWALRLGTSLEDRPRYTATTTFETFPFPRPNDMQRRTIAAATTKLIRLRNAWLDPTGASAAELKKRTLTNLYNERPAWLANAHSTLDASVADAYGWPADVSQEDALGRLLSLNFEREPA